MAIDLSSVLGQPAAPATPEAPAAAATDEGGGIPDAILEIPEMAAILQGTPPAVWTTRDDPSPEVQTIVQHADELQGAGFGFYGGKDGTTTVLFNTQFVSPEEMQAADNKGKLRDFATPFSELKASLSGAAPAAEAPSAGAPPQMASAAPGAGFDKKLGTKRLKNLAVGSPTSGATPGQGRLLSALGTPPV